MMKNPRPYHPQVAVVIDEKSMMRLAPGCAIASVPSVAEMRGTVGRMGAPYGQYLLDDVAAGRVHAKLYVFTSAWCLSAQKRANLLKSTRGTTRIWCYAPGYFDGYTKSLDAMKDLTGFTLKPVSPETALATPTKLGRDMGMQKPFGPRGPVHPLFAAVDVKPSEVLATYPDGSAAVAMRRTSSGISIFAGAPGLTPDLVRLAGRLAGVHLFTQIDCNVYGNGPFLALHAAQDGPVTIDTGRDEPVTDLLTGEPIGNGPKVTLTMKRGRTRILQIGQE
jgi:hypothetical protein